MVGLPYDCLANPLGAVRLTFEKAVSSGLNPSTSDGSDWGAVDIFNQFLFDDNGISQVPTLNATSVKYLQPNTLVRFRGMVQDMFGNEFYVGAYKDGSNWRTNKYSDISQCEVELSPDMRLWERRLLYCVPVPGLNSWAEPLEASSNQQKIMASQQREKRPRDDDELVDHMEMETNQGGQDSPITKKMKEKGNPSSSAMQQDITSDGAALSFEPPDSETNSFPCLVKVYNSPESDLKLNEVFEFIGVLSHDSELPLNKDESDLLSNSFYEDNLVQLPPSKVPRIHCLVHKKLVVGDFVDRPPMTDTNTSLIRGTREGLLKHLTAVLGNDGVAAQYLLLHLLSKVHARVDGVAVGKLSLNFTNFNKEAASVFGTPLTLAMKELLPFTQHMSLTIDYLNTASLALKKDYQANKCVKFSLQISGSRKYPTPFFSYYFCFNGRLVSGVLQLAEGSHLTIDETQLQSGTLNSTGVENAKLLTNLTEFQQVEYDFQYYKMEMAADVQLLVLSEGKSNILPADSVIPFQPSSTGTGTSTIVDETMVQSWRWYLANMRSLSHSISPEMQKVVEQDLVAARQDDRSLGSQDFSRLLTMSRLMSLSFGETSLSMEHWQMVKELERLRKDRLR